MFAFGCLAFLLFGCGEDEKLNFYGPSSDVEAQSDSGDSGDNGGQNGEPGGDPGGEQGDNSSRDDLEQMSTTESTWNSALLLQNQSATTIENQSRNGNAESI